MRNDIDIKSTGSLNCSDVPSSLARGTYSCDGNAASAVSNDQSTDEESGRSDLSAGAKAGIALGTIGLVAILAASGFFIFKWRQRQQTTHPTEAREETEPAPSYQERGFGGGETKDDYEMEYYSVQPHYDGSSQKELIQRSSEMGRPASSGRPGPEGRHEMFNTKDLPAAHELAGTEVGKEER